MTSSSHRAQRLQTYTSTQKPTELLPLTMSLFESYHINGKAPSDIKELSKVAVEHGIFGNEAEAQRWIEGDACEKETRLGGVPFFVFGGKYGSSGALPVDDFVEVSQRTAYPQHQ
jgi:predicted DsbA family dithiol-disulfide isomerase